MSLFKRYFLLFLISLSSLTSSAVVDSTLLNTSGNTICYDSCRAYAVVQVFSASSTGPFRIIWRSNLFTAQGIVDTVLTSDTIFNLCAGNYSVEVIDLSDNSKKLPTYFVINEALQINASFTLVRPACPDSANGSISTTITNATLPVKYQWSSHINDTNSTLSGLSAGKYGITITDSNGCVFSDSVLLSNHDTLKANILGNDISCKGLCDGSVSISPSGGFGNYSILWSNTDTNLTISNLCAGNFSVSITDDLGCTATDSFLVEEPDSLLASYSTLNTSCNNSCDGSVTANVTGGVAPYHYHWSGYQSQDSLMTNTCAGLITSTITDSNGCFYTENITITEPDELNIQSVITASTCNVCDGSISVVVSGGTGIYSYLWLGQKAEDTIPLIDSLCAGIYRLAVTDSASCTDTFDIVLSDDTSGIKDLGFLTSKASCVNVCDGSILANVIGGNAPYSYLWSPGNQTDSIVTGICPGSYSLEVTDFNGCKRIELIGLSAKSNLNAVVSTDFDGCNGDCGGSASVMVSGGIGPYSFDWNGSNSTGSNAFNLCQGTYPFKITDNAGCVLIDTAFINEADTIGIGLNIINSLCYGDCDGQASISVTGGQGPYNIIWSTGYSGNSVNNLCAGSYWVEVIDANSCAKRKNFTIVNPTQIQINATLYHPDCGVNNGSIVVNPSGGQGPYSTNFFNGSDSIGRLYPSLTFPYIVEITDNNGCSVTDSFILTNTNAPPFNYSLQHETCPGSCDGIISLSAPGVNGPIDFIWLPSFPGSTGIKTKGGFCPGTYYVGIEAEGCINVEEVVIQSAKRIEVDFDISDPSCQNNCDGYITANISGGYPPYNINWSNSSTLNTISGLCSGSYTINITDSRGCLFSEEVVLNDPSAIDVNLTTSNLICYNECDGKITSAVSGGSGQYSYQWSTGGNGPVAENLCAGSYYLLVTDGNGCAGSDSISIGNGVPITAGFTATPAGCGSCDGALSVSASSGNGLPYTYKWSTGETTSSISDLIAGLYSVEIKDNAGCAQTFTAIINNVGGPTLNDSVSDASCFGSCDGYALTTASGATAPYFYQWTDPLMQTGDSAGGLCEGLYYYSATDSNGCVSFDSVYISEGNEIQVSSQITGVSCPGEADGIVGISISGGSSPYSILWSNSDTTDITDSLSPGIYSVIITDSLNCTFNDTFNLQNPPAISISFVVFNANCFGSCDGVVKAMVSGGSPPYSYSWNDPQNQMTNIAAGLCSGYTELTVTDSKGCVHTDSALINAPLGISSLPTLSNPTCKDGENGTISLVISGGIAPYSVDWNNGMSGLSVSGLKAGNYSATITDANQCVLQVNYTLNPPVNPLTIGNFTITKPACGNNNGSVSANVSGGSGNYLFSWNTLPPRTTSSITGIWAGMYEVTVTDAISGCIAKKTAIVENTGAPALSISKVDESCFQNCNGSATVVGSNSGSVFLWDDSLSQTGITAVNLCKGFYSVMTIDSATGCVSIDTVTIGSSDLDIDVLTVTPVNCFGDCNGNASVQGVGLNQPFDYSWNTVPGQFNQTATNLCGGIYTATVTDTTGCSSSAAININEVDSITIDLTILSNVLCSGSCTGKASALVSGGNPPYSYNWNGVAGNMVNINLCQGINTLEVIDSKGCIQTLSFVISDSDPIIANAITIAPTCGEYNGSISLNPSGGQGPYFYQWSTGHSANTIQGLFAGIYSVVISDVNGCSENFSFFLNNPNAPLLTFENNTVDCNGDCNGVARVVPVGGVGPYSYLWNHVPVSTKDSLNELCAGIYFLKVTDAAGCISFGADTIGEPLVLEAVLNKISDGCGGLCEGEAVVIPQGGTSPYSYTWNSIPPQTSASATNLCQGFASVVVRDANDCLIEDSVEIVPPPALIIDSLLVTNASCFTNEDGEASVYFTGGTAPVGINWSMGQTTQTAIDLKNGQIFVVLTDTNGCTASDTAIIGVNDTVLVTAFTDSIVCIGSRTLLFAEGQGATTYQWFEDSSGVLKSIGAGDSIYYTITDTVTIYLRGQNSVTPPCFDLDTALIVGIPAPVIVASATSTTIEEGESTELNASPFLFNGLYAWTPSSTLNDSASIAPIATPEETTTYLVIGTNEFGCSGSDSITINVIENTDIINGFSPNGDGVNDLWIIPGLEDYPNVIVEVYSRWGVQVFRSDGYRDPWDGTFEGNKLPNASYYYVIDYFGDGERVATGAVTLLY